MLQYIFFKVLSYFGRYGLNCHFCSALGVLKKALEVQEEAPTLFRLIVIP